MKKYFRVSEFLAIASLIFSFAGCGSGVSSSDSAGTNANQTASVSSGEITAFGSVFVNGHEFNTSHANLVDDDTGNVSSFGDVSAAGQLEAGMVVTVNSASGSTPLVPIASEIHVSPLVRGFVEASNTTDSTIAVLGQKIILTSGTIFRDRRVCLTSASHCPTITGQDGLAQSAGTAQGTFVTVHGYLFSNDTGSTQITATLVTVLDYSAASHFKLEGEILSASAATSSVPATLTIGTETVELSKTVCVPVTKCAIGSIVAAQGTTAPVSKVFAPDAIRLVRLLPQTPGATVEIEGRVSKVKGTNFVVHGIRIDGSALPSPLPAVGDKVEVFGKVSSDGTSVIATSIGHIVPVLAARLVFAGYLTSVTAGIGADTYIVSVLGQSAIVDVNTRIADHSVSVAPTFNIKNFQSYLDGKTPFVIVRTLIDSSGKLHATGFDVVKTPAKQIAGVSGPVYAAPVIGTDSSSVTVHGVNVIYKQQTVKSTMHPIVIQDIVPGSYIFATGALTANGAVDTTVAGGTFYVLPNGANDHSFDSF